jgi:hypothetical protein
MHRVHGTANIAQSPEDLRAKVKAQVVEGKPAFFKLEAPLPKQSRTDTPVAASEKMWVVLKTYAADGENGLPCPPERRPHLCRPPGRSDVLWAERRDTHDRQERRRTVTARHVFLVPGDEP